MRFEAQKAALTYGYTRHERWDRECHLYIGRATNGLWAVVVLGSTKRLEFVHWFETEPSGDDARFAARGYFGAPPQAQWRESEDVLELPVAEELQGFLFDTGIPKELEGKPMDGIAILGLAAPKPGEGSTLTRFHEDASVLCACYRCRQAAVVPLHHRRLDLPCGHGSSDPVVLAKKECVAAFSDFRRQPQDTHTAECVEVDGDTLRVRRFSTKVHYEKGYLVRSVSETHSLVNTIGGEKRAVIKRARKDVECPATDVVRITEKSEDRRLYVGASGFNDFLAKNGGYFMKSGFVDFMAGYAGVSDPEDAFWQFIAVGTQFPVVEQLVKAGFAHLVGDAMGNAAKKESLRDAAGAFRDLGRLLNEEATSSGKAFRLPAYARDYLRARGASVDECLVWQDILDREGIVKERFLELVKEPMFIASMTPENMRLMRDVLRFEGYSLRKTVAYLHKIVTATEHTWFRAKLHTLRDYLDMCDQLGLPHVAYPKNLTAVHDQAAVALKSKENEAMDRRLLAKAIQCEARLDAMLADKKCPQYVKEAMGRLDIVFPRSFEDLYMEHVRMNNCVNGYGDKILRGECVVFFIRKKGDPEGSFVTGECRKGGLGQLMYSANRVVHDLEVRQLAEWLCRGIVHLVRSIKDPAQPVPA